MRNCSDQNKRAEGSRTSVSKAKNARHVDDQGGGFLIIYCGNYRSRSRSPSAERGSRDASGSKTLASIAQRSKTAACRVLDSLFGHIRRLATSTPALSSAAALPRTQQAQNPSAGTAHSSRVTPSTRHNNACSLALAGRRRRVAPPLNTKESTAHAPPQRGPELPPELDHRRRH